MCFSPEPYTNKRIFIYWTTRCRLSILVSANIYLKSVLKVLTLLLFNKRRCRHFYVRFIRRLQYHYVLYAGYLKDKICVLVTHQMQYLASVDQVVIMENV